MGLRYLLFRLKHDFLRRSGLLAIKFPVQPSLISPPKLGDALKSLEQWPWKSRDSFSFKLPLSEKLREEAGELLAGKIRLFGHILYKPENRNDWHRHPETGFHYNKNLHWTKIPDFSPEAGDIKYVWERGRFGHIQTIMRFDLHSGEDHAAWVLEEMESFIQENPVNCGPHYRCSQEISLRLINWLGAISFYRNSPELTESRWKTIWQHLYWQAHHVRQNIHFSRIAVRNNHAITETLLLYIFGTLFPDAPGCREWKASGKKWFEEEIAYQIYPDGSYLQFSMNYHRVVVQLLTLGIRFCSNAGDSFSAVVYERACASLRFLQFFQDPLTGWLPNYGANDGALFFRFTDAHYRDYRPQLASLASALGKDGLGENADNCWFGTSDKEKCLPEQKNLVPTRIFTEGGFAGIRTENGLLFFRCGSHRDRPSQADNLHMDLWYDGRNLLRDAGSYKYNSAPEDVRFFFGTMSHNCIMVENADQMEKGPRFVWLNWSQSSMLQAMETEEEFVLTGEISAFRHVESNILHQRKIRMKKSSPEWIIEDRVSGHHQRKLNLLWHPGPDFFPEFSIEVADETGKILEAVKMDGWYSENYGIREPAPFLSFQSAGGYFQTRIMRP